MGMFKKIAQGVMNVIISTLLVIMIIGMLCKGVIWAWSWLL